MIRRLVAGLIVLGLAIGIWALWPREGSDPTPTTIPTAVATTTTVAPSTTTTTLPSTTTTPDTQVVATAEEAEEILRTLWFGWFEGIYNQDEARIREVVGTQAMLDAARAAMGTIDFADQPTSEGIEFVDSELLLATEECAAIWSRSDAAFLGPGAPREGVDVLRWWEDRWVLASTWTHRDDLWEADCESELSSLS